MEELGGISIVLVRKLRLIEVNNWNHMTSTVIGGVGIRLALASQKKPISSILCVVVKSMDLIVGQIGFFAC